MSIRIILADDHRMFREGLRGILASDASLEVVGEASNGRVAVELATGPLSPDVVVMDIGMPELNGVDATRQICSRNPEAGVIALSAHADRRFIDAILQAGASGYVLKESAGEEILLAIHTVHGGRKYLSPAPTDLIVEGYVSRRGADGVTASPRLAPREREVLQLIAEGKTSKEIAKALGISDKTADVHRRNIMKKLDLYSVAELTKYAVREGMTSG